MLDEQQYKSVSGNCGFEQVPQISGSDAKQVVQADGGEDISIQKNGYLFVFVSNESYANVYFDDLRVEHQRGALLEENQYYPYGLKMTGISSKAALSIQNNFQYQAAFSEHDDETGYNEFALRNYDPQVGRFAEADPFDQFASGYVGMGNNPINFIDPSGGLGINFGALGEITGSVLGDRLLAAAGGALVGYGIDRLTGGKGGWGAAIGGAAGFGVTFIPPFDIGAIGSSVKEEVSNIAVQVAEVTSKRITAEIITITQERTPLPVIVPNRPPSLNIQPIPSSVSKTEQAPSPSAPWMNTARGELGVREKTGNNDGEEVDKYLRTVGLAGSGQPWCGAFVNWTLRQNGIKGVPVSRETHPARALDWRNFGQNLSNPAFGSIVTLKRPGGGHVGFTAAIDADRPGWIIVLGGNQSDHVNYRSYPKNILKFNYPQNFTPSYNLPSMRGIPRGIRMQ